jgi:uncharacterized membrane protein
MEQIRNALKIPLDNNKRKFTQIDAGPYFYFSYLPQIPAVWFGKFLNLGLGYILYLGRLFGLLFYIACVWFALRAIPIGKYLMLTVSLFPICLAQAASWNADCVLFSLSFLSIALILKMSFSKEDFKFNKDLILGIVIMLIMGVLKVVYIPIAGLLFLLPRLFSKKKYLSLFLTISIILLCLVLTYIWRKAYTLGMVNASLGLNSPQKIDQLLQNPMIFIDVISETLRVFETMYYQSTIGILGYLDTILPKGVYSMFTFLVIIVALFEADKMYKLLINQRIVLLLVSLGVFLITILAMYIVSRPESGLVAEGVQGRYFIPAVFPFFMVFYGMIPLKINLSSNKYLTILLFCALIVLLYRTEMTLIHRYFGKI